MRWPPALSAIGDRRAAWHARLHGHARSAVAWLRATALRVMPRTMTGLVGGSMLAVTVPLLLVLVVLGTTLDGLMQRGQLLVAQCQNIEVLGARLQMQLRDLERTARHLRVLDDPALRPLFDTRREQAARTAQAVAREGVPEALGVRAAQLAGQVGELRPSSAPRDIEALGAQAAALLGEARESVQRQITELHDRSEATQRTLTLSALLAIPLTAMLTVLLAALIIRPMDQLRASISALGTSNFQEPVRIRYPLEVARLGEKLDWLRRRLRDLEADKDRFLRHVSHELKTPLASLREGTDLLLEDLCGPLNPRQREVARILAASARDLDAQIRNLLAYAEWRSGQRDLGMSWVDTRAMIGDVLRAQRLPLSQRGLDVVTLACDPLYGHPNSLRIALDNLLSNAAKHAPQDSCIEIGAEYHAGLCRLSVRDYGRGVPESERAQILEPFVRGSEPEESGRGTGIGLSIVNETVKAHGGGLEIQDARPGARFVLAWPGPAPAGG